MLLVREVLSPSGGDCKWNLHNGKRSLARAKGRRIGTPVVEVDSLKIAAMRAAGDSWNKIRLELGIGKGTAQRALLL
jgi:hypothetical protein